MKGLKPSVYSSLAMAFAGIGDAFLYPFLPLYSKEIGIPVVWVGVLLSINRFVRILIGPFITFIFQHFQPRQVSIAASFVAVCCTISYGLNAGIFSWLLFRILWGICFSVLRVSVASFALKSQSTGVVLGLSNGIYEIGPLIALCIGPFIVLHVGIEHTFYVLAVLSSLALLFSYKIPANDWATSPSGSISIREPTFVSVLAFVTAFIADGLVIIGLTVCIQREYSLPIIEAATISSGLLILRRICNLLVSPIGGMIIDYFGFRKIIFASVLLVSAGLILLTSHFVFAGLTLIFISSPVSNAALMLAAAGNENHLNAINQVTISRDAGGAAGTFLGGIFLSAVHLDTIMLMTALVAIFLVVTFIKPSKDI